MSLREAAEMALEFCEFLWREVAMNDYAEEKRDQVETALRDALAEAPKVEAVVNQDLTTEPVRPRDFTISAVDALDSLCRQNDIFMDDHNSMLCDTIRAALAEASRAEAEAPNPWKEAVHDALVINWAFTAEHEDNPRKAVSDLIAQEVRMALDPLISSDAQALIDRGRAEAEPLREQKDAAYLERNQCVALIARMAVAMGLRVRVTKTAIEGWSDDWHGCVYITLPTGQVSWHFHYSQAHLFSGLPAGAETWDGHDTPEKYRRVAAAFVETERDAAEPVATFNAYPSDWQYSITLTPGVGMLPDGTLLYLHPPCRESAWKERVGFRGFVSIVERLRQFAMELEGTDACALARDAATVLEEYTDSNSRESAELSEDDIARHSVKAGECPPQSEVVLVSSLRRLAVLRAAGGEK